MCLGKNDEQVAVRHADASGGYIIENQHEEKRKREIQVNERGPEATNEAYGHVGSCPGYELLTSQGEATKSCRNEIRERVGTTVERILAGEARKDSCKDKVAERKRDREMRRARIELGAGDVPGEPGEKNVDQVEQEAPNTSASSDPYVALEHPVRDETPSRLGSVLVQKSCDVEDDEHITVHWRSVGVVSRRRCRRSQEVNLMYWLRIGHVSTLPGGKVGKLGKVIKRS